MVHVAQDRARACRERVRPLEILRRHDLAVDIRHPGLDETPWLKSAVAAKPIDRICWPTGQSDADAMSDDQINEKIDEAVLALLYLGIVEHYPMGGARTWKSFDWDAMERLHEKELISNPVSKAKSVVLTDAGLARAETAYRRLFDPDG